MEAMTADSRPEARLEAEAADSDRTEANRRRVVAGFWPKLKAAIARIPFASDVVAAYFCAMDPRSPTKVRAILLAALAYFVVPLDLVPDFLALFGFADDATVVAAAVAMVAGHITDEHRAKARAALSDLGAADAPTDGRP